MMKRRNYMEGEKRRLLQVKGRAGIEVRERKMWRQLSEEYSKSGLKDVLGNSYRGWKAI